MDWDKVQRDQVNWHETGVPVSALFDDPYFSLGDGLAESRHVFLDGNGLPERFRDGFHVAELGFGTGLNALATLLAWQRSGSEGRFYFTSFEVFPMDVEDMERALAVWPELSRLSAHLLAAWGRNDRIVEIDAMRLEVIVGDARETLPNWTHQADAWYLDGFSPAKNPEMWGREIMNNVQKHTAPGGTVATYSAAGAVRQNLADAGFEVERKPGFGRKRHMTVGRLL